jgi:hypothetical protein
VGWSGVWAGMGLSLLLRTRLGRSSLPASQPAHPESPTAPAIPPAQLGLPQLQEAYELGGGVERVRQRPATADRERSHELSVDLRDEHGTGRHVPGVQRREALEASSILR